MGLIPALLGPIWDSGPGPGVKSRNTEHLFHLCFFEFGSGRPLGASHRGPPPGLGGSSGASKFNPKAEDFDAPLH